MTTHRRYFFQHPGEIEGVHDQVLALLRHECERRWWYNEPEVTGAAFNRMTFSFEVCGRDQWWCHKRATDLGGLVYETLGMTRKQVPVPMWENLPPHENRGRYRVSTQ